MNEPDQEPRLIRFLRDSGDRSFRSFVHFHANRGSLGMLKLATVGMLAMLEWRIRVWARDFLNVMEENLLDDPDFWSDATCRQAFARIIAVAREELPLQLFMPAPEDALDPLNCDLSFLLYQSTTLHFALLERGACEKLQGKPHGPS